MPYDYFGPYNSALTVEAESVEAVLGALDLQQEREDGVVDLEALRVEHYVDGPRSLKGRPY